MTTATRRLLGITALAMVIAGVGWLVAGSDDRSGGILVRTGLLVGAAWLVAPVVRRPAPATVAFVVALVAVLARPRLIFGVAVAALLWRFGARKR